MKTAKNDTSSWRGGGKIANLVADVYFMMYGGSIEQDISIWHLMTSEIMVKPDLCGFLPLHLDVVTQTGNTSGQTVVLPTGQPNINLRLKPNAVLIKHTLVDVFSSSR